MNYIDKLRDFIDFNHNFNPSVRILSEKQENNYKISDIEIENSQGRIVQAFLLNPNENINYSGIHFIHWLETEASDSNRSQFLPYAKEFAKKGYVSILPDCFWSLDKDKFKKNPKQYTDGWWRTEFNHDSKLIKRQLLDLICVHKVLIAHNNVNSDKIALVGHDFGAMIGSLLASLGYHYKFYCFIAFTGRFSDWFRFGSKLPKEDPNLFHSYIKKMDFLDPINHIQNIDPNPILMLFAEEDFYVPKNKAEELYQYAGKNKEIRWYESGHGMNQQTFDDMEEWLLRKL